MAGNPAFPLAGISSKMLNKSIILIIADLSVSDNIYIRRRLIESRETFPGGEEIHHQSSFVVINCSIIMRSSVKRPPTPDVEEEEQDRQPSLQEIINLKFAESGEKERLKELLRERLIECGWKDEMKSHCSLPVYELLGRLMPNLREFAKEWSFNLLLIISELTCF
ncbi:OLC1v1028653C1 [Oldenlandia corymbosa var. corymbosa]|uniref:OLC1v1028653C1 n=1 Tax=Oldenlandia corymbosa var. corymbosa TaxID=529605 RepID=A0AAV1CE02_OLDCO|nr:OLC1v1028653C1 [Oldenlandia corymbosa var. corymbosa]